MADFHQKLAAFDRLIGNREPKWKSWLMELGLYAEKLNLARTSRTDEDETEEDMIT